MVEATPSALLGLGWHLWDPTVAPAVPVGYIHRAVRGPH